MSLPPSKSPSRRAATSNNRDVPKEQAQSAQKVTPAPSPSLSKPEMEWQYSDSTIGQSITQSQAGGGDGGNQWIEYTRSQSLDDSLWTTSWPFPDDGAMSPSPNRSRTASLPNLTVGDDDNDMMDHASDMGMGETLSDWQNFNSASHPSNDAATINPISFNLDLYGEAVANQPS